MVSQGSRTGVSRGDAMVSQSSRTGVSTSTKKIGWVRCMKRGKASPKIENLPKSGTRRLVIMDSKMVALHAES